MRCRDASAGFTLIEVVLTISILGILAVSAMPNFMALTTQAEQSGRDGIVGAVRMGVAIWRSNDIVVNGPPGNYPATLDPVANNTACSAANPCFVTVVGVTGIRDGNWTKLSNTQYQFFDGQNNFVFTYTPAAGTFLAPNAP